MVRFLFAIWVGFISYLGMAQNRQAQVWKYGADFGNTLDFGYSPLKRTKSISKFSLGVASICDSNGLYQFSGRSGGIVNRKDSVMPNGKTQPKYGYAGYGCELIIPFQNDSRKYHYFMISDPNVQTSKPGEAIYHFTIDMTLDNGKGDMDTTKTEIIDTTAGFQIACMLHANGRDSWLIARGFQSDTLMAFLVTDSGVAQKVITDINSQVKKPNLPHDVGSRYDSQLKSSPDSRLLFIPRRMKEYPFSELLQFNRETGVFSYRIVIPDTMGNFNITNYGDGCFSPDGTKLYYSIGTKTQASWEGDGPGHFWQYDLSNYDSAAIVQSKIFLGRLGRRQPNVAEAWAWAPKMQLAMDGKIYISPGIETDKYMSTIRCPDKTGPDCGLEFRTIDLGDGKNGAYFPTLNQTFVRNAGIFQVQANKRKLCRGDTLEISGYGAGAEHFTWSVSPALPQGVKVDTLTWQKISTTNIPAGSYTFACQAFSRCGDVFEKSLQIEILPLPPRPNLVVQQKPVPCKGDSVNISVQNPQTGNRYFWSTGDSTSSLVVKQTGLYSMDSISNTFGCGIRVGDTVAVTIKNVPIPPVPVIAGPKVVEVCEGQVAMLKVETQNAKVVWSNGEVGDSITVNSGQFTVYSETAEGCRSGSSDTVRVVSVPNPRPVYVNLDSVLSRESLLNQNYCVSGLPGSRFSFSVQNGTIVDSSEDCATVNWKEGNISRSIAVSETLKEAGCIGTANQTLYYRPNIEIPNLITPNGDGSNDTFVIQDLEFYPNHRLQIFNRWGKRVIDTANYKQDWAGAEGIYFFNLNLDGKLTSGWVQVVK